MLFSIIVPIYNAKNYIHKCIDSILSQKSKDYELLLVDDGSTDGSSSICDEYAETSHQIRVIHKKNGGVVSARAIGIKEAKGEYILYVDADDWVAENWLEKISEQIYSVPEKPDIVVFGSIGIYNDRQATHIINTPEGFYDRSRLEAEIFPRLISDKIKYIEDAVILPAPWNKAYKRELLEKYRCYDETITIGEDNAFVFECFLNAQSIVVCKDILYYYNKLNPDSALAKPDLNRLRKRVPLFKYLKERLTPYASMIKNQIDVFYACVIIYDIVNMYKNTSDIKKAGRHLKEELKTTGLLKYVHIRKIPLRAGMVILLLKMRMCKTVLWGLKKLKKM